MGNNKGPAEFGDQEIDDTYFIQEPLIFWPVLQPQSHIGEFISTVHLLALCNIL